MSGDGLGDYGHVSAFSSQPQGAPITARSELRIESWIRGEDDTYASTTRYVMDLGVGTLAAGDAIIADVDLSGNFVQRTYDSLGRPTSAWDGARSAGSGVDRAPGA